MVAIYKYRVALGKTQVELASEVGVNPNTISQYESGARKPDIVMLKKLAKALNTTTDELLGPIEADN
jgi:transcriptional regulator with XRE-family HTH domain